MLMDHEKGWIGVQINEEFLKPEWIDQFSKKPSYIFDLLSTQEPESNHAFWIKTMAIYEGGSA